MRSGFICHFISSIYSNRSNLNSSVGVGHADEKLQRSRTGRFGARCSVDRSQPIGQSSQQSWSGPGCGRKSDDLPSRFPPRAGNWHQTGTWLVVAFGGILEIDHRGIIARLHLRRSAPAQMSSTISWLEALSTGDLKSRLSWKMGSFLSTKPSPLRLVASSQCFLKVSPLLLTEPNI